jgi:hypothetical protein
VQHDLDTKPRAEVADHRRVVQRTHGTENRTSLFIQSLLDAGVRLFYYFSDEEVTIDGAVDKFMINVRNFASELEREKISQRTHEHLLTKARKGLNVGGRVYGYDNVEVKSGDQRVRVEYRVNEQQAEIIREIFRRYAAGDGLRTIVKDLNARAVAPPRAGKRGTGSWAPSAVFAMLRRERYRGTLVWNTREKTYKGGTKVRVARDESEWIRVDCPDLRIVDDEAWFAVQAQMRPRTEQADKRTGGGRPPRHMLSGLARCAECGGPMAVTNGKSSHATVKVYACSYSRDRGKSVCRNSLRRPVDAVNRAMTDWIVNNVLSEDFVLEVLRQLRHRLAGRAKTTTSDVPQLDKEATRLRSEIGRLVGALACTDQQPEAIVRAVAERQEQLSTLEARLRAAKTAPEAIQLEVRRMEAEAKKRIADARTALERNPEEARRVVGMLFPGPLTMAPVDTAEGKRFWIEGAALIGRMFATDGGCLNVASPAGTYRLPCTILVA